MKLRKRVEGKADRFKITKDQQSIEIILGSGEVFCLTEDRVGQLKIMKNTDLGSELIVVPRAANVILLK